MVHYAIIRQPIYIEKPFHQEEMHLIYSGMYGRIYKYRDAEYDSFITKYSNVIGIDQSFSKKYKTIFEGKINLNEYENGDIVEIEYKKYEIKEVIKSVDNKITYTVSEKHFVKCDDYTELLDECERKFEEYETKKKESEKESIEIEVPKKKGF